MIDILYVIKNQTNQSKRKMSITTRSLAMNMRPHISKILNVPECLECFEQFSKTAFIQESVECIIEIRRFMAISDDKVYALYAQLRNIVRQFISESSTKTVNLPSDISQSILRYSQWDIDSFGLNVGRIRTVLTSAEDELAVTLSYRIPHFTSSTHWMKFVNEHPELVKQCITDHDLKKWDQIRYRKKDFMSDRFTDKEVALFELMKEDQSFFRLLNTSLDGALSVYLWDGKDLLDEDDIDKGKFQGFKVSGILPYPSWMVMTAVSSTSFHSHIWDGCKFDREYDFNYKPANETDYDTHICKLIIDYGKLLEYRSCYVITNNLYSGNRTCLMTRSIEPFDGQYTPNIIKADMKTDIFAQGEERHPTRTSDPHINMKGRKKCVYLPNLSLFTVQPMGDNQSLFSFINLLNPGGILLSKIGTPEKRMLDIARNYRANMIREIKHLLDDDRKGLKSLSNVYDAVQSKLNLFKERSRTTTSHIFESSFDHHLSNLPSL